MNEKVLSRNADPTRGVLLSLKKSLCDAIEAAANARAMTMSAWMREAIIEKLAREAKGQ